MAVARHECGRRDIACSALAMLVSLWLLPPAEARDGGLDGVELAKRKAAQAQYTKAAIQPQRPSPLRAHS